jgi:transcription-repair coupling factor (superfamily II helicase)
LNPVPAAKEMRKRSFTIRCGDTLEVADLARKLTELDYDDELEVYVPGEFSRRGGILDVFSPSAKYPARIEFFGDEVESIRLFTPGSQRSIETVDSYEIILRSGSGSEFLESGNISEYLTEWSPYLIPVFPQVLQTHVERFAPDAMEKWNAFLQSFGKKTVPFYDDVESALQEKVTTPPVFSMHKQLEKALPKGGEKAFTELGRQWMQETTRRLVLENKYSCVMLCRSEADKKHFQEWIREAKLEQSDSVILEEKYLPGGVFCPGKKLLLLTAGKLKFLQTAMTLRI